MAGADKDTGRPARRSRRCPQCTGPDRPLQKDCVLHSKRAAARASKKTTNEKGAAPSPLPLNNTQNDLSKTPPPNPPPSVIGNSPRDPFLDNNGSSSRPEPPQPDHDGSPRSYAASPILPRVQSSPQGSPGPPLQQAPPPISFEVIDPVLREPRPLWAPEEPPRPIMGRPSPPREPVPAPDGHFLVPSTPSGRSRSHFMTPMDMTPSFNSSPSRSPSTSVSPSIRAAARGERSGHGGHLSTRPSRTLNEDGERLRCTNLNAHHGFMIASKGDEKYPILRPGRLFGRAPKGEIIKKFNKQLDQILIRCERLYDETDAWIYVAAHHPTAPGEYTHWSSPSFASDVPPDFQLPFHQDAAGIFGALKAARRHDVASVELKCAKLRSAVVVAEEAAAAAEERANAAERKLQEQQAAMDMFSRHMRFGGGFPAEGSPSGSMTGHQPSFDMFSRHMRLGGGNPVQGTASGSTTSFPL
ncbi:hypothetical protein V5O48_008471 [Marasmius crinis-equi]|uniref:Uncharacterized protein n=1 Tax=Marasmius crinis-equi TaxID=585013 RepID=A0ABR3FE96_9AGAR